MLPHFDSMNEVTEMADDDADFRWLGPAGISAIAAAVAAIVGLVALLVQIYLNTDATKGVGSSTSTSSSRQAGSSLNSDASRPVGTVAELVAVVETYASKLLLEDGSIHRFALLAEQSGSVQFDTPIDWGNQRVGPWLNDAGSKVGVSLVASPDISRFYNEWGTPGLFVGVSEKPAALEGYSDQRSSFYEQSCISLGGNTISNSKAKGAYRIWANCGEAKSMVVGYETTNSKGYVLELTANIVQRNDVDVFSQALNTLAVKLPLTMIPAKKAGPLAPGFRIP